MGLFVGHLKSILSRKTDEAGHENVKHRVSMLDLFATIADQTGIDQNRVSYPKTGRHETMTDVEVTGAEV